MLLPVRNGAATLEESVRSILAQDLRHLELLIVDDGSSDGSRALAEGLAREDERIRVLTCPAVGIVEALRRGGEAVRGRYIARMDADDVALPNRLTRQRAYLEAHPNVGLCGGIVERIGEPAGQGRERYETWINSLVTPAAIRRDLFVECPIPHPTFFMRREAYTAVDGYRDRGWPEDYDLVLRFAAAGYDLGKPEGTVLRWRHRAGRLSLTDPRYSLDQFRNLKRYFLMDTYLRGRERFHQWGAGEVGKAWLREWTARAPEAVVELNPRKIGKAIHGVPVIAPEALPGPGETFTLVAVGAPGAREDIRRWFRERGYTELADYICVA